MVPDMAFLLEFGTTGGPKVAQDDAPPPIIIGGLIAPPEEEKEPFRTRTEEALFESEETFGRENISTHEIRLRRWVDANVEGVAATVRNAFVDTWIAVHPDFGFGEFISNPRFLNGAAALPVWQEIIPPPSFKTPDGRVLRFDLHSGPEEIDAADRKFFQQSPTIQTFDLFGAIANIKPRSRGGRGGGGGGGRAARVFDTRQLEEAAANMWRSLLLEVDDQAITDAVQAYMKQANSFWVTQGGDLDFETFVLDKIRATERHGQLYRRKPDAMTEQQYLGQFQQSVSTGGGGALRPTQQLEQLERSVQSGGSPSGQQRRVQRSEDVRLANPSNFAAQFAGQVASLGRAALR